jgi:hypothetical protein
MDGDRQADTPQTAPQEKDDCRYPQTPRARLAEIISAAVAALPAKSESNSKPPTCPTGKKCFASVDAIREHLRETSTANRGTFSAFNCRKCEYMHLDKRQDKNRPASQPAEAVA